MLSQKGIRTPVHAQGLMHHPAVKGVRHIGAQHELDRIEFYPLNKSVLLRRTGLVVLHRHGFACAVHTNQHTVSLPCLIHLVHAVYA